MKKFCSFMLCLLMLISLVGCAASKSENMSIDMEAGSIGNNWDGMFGNSESADDLIMSDQPTKNPQTPDSEKTDEYLQTQKLIYSCSLDVETLEFNKTTAKVKELIDQYGGFVESDILSDDSWNWYSSNYEKTNATLCEIIKIRIPTEKYSDFLKEINGIAKIRNKNESVTNITKKYNDTQTTITMYEKEEAMLLEMMDKATSISDMLTVESRLAEVQRNLALYRSSMSTMETDLAFSTITMTIEEVVEYTIVEQQISFGERIVVAIKDSWENFIEFAEDFSILIIHIFPFAIVLIIIVAIFIIITKHRKNKRNKQATVHAAQCASMETKIKDRYEK